MKLIDADKLIENCKKYLEDTYTFQTPLEYSVAMTRLLKIIEAQPKLSLENKTSDIDVPDTNVGKWIPCSERLPIHEGEYLVACKGKYRHFTEVLYFQHGRFLSCLCEVVAWFDAPLPEPYKGEE